MKLTTQEIYLLSIIVQSINIKDATVSMGGLTSDEIAAAYKLADKQLLKINAKYQFIDDTLHIALTPSGIEMAQILKLS